MVKFELSNYFSPLRLLYWRRLLWQSQYFSADQLRALQWKLLASMLDHCMANVPFYIEKCRALGLERGDLKSIDDLQKFPIVHKQDLFDHHDHFKPVHFKKYRTVAAPTSGTTGSPLTVYWDVNVNILELLCQWRHYAWFGYRLGMPFMDIRNYQQHLTDKFSWNWKCRGLETSIGFWDESNIEQCADMLRKRKILFWRGHPNAMFQLALLLEEAGIEDVKPELILSNGEELLADKRIFLERWSGKRMGDNYGLSEHTALICRCPAGCYHTASEYGIIEILKNDDQPASPGEEGRIISTGLHNLVFPLIRYDTGDLAIQSEKVCSCERTLPVVQGITGRIDDFILDDRGNHHYALHRYFKFTEGVRFSQLVQNSPQSLDVYLVPARTFDPSIENSIRDGLLAELGSSMKIHFHHVDKVPCRSPRKTKFAVNYLNRKA